MSVRHVLFASILALFVFGASGVGGLALQDECMESCGGGACACAPDCSDCLCCLDVRTFAPAGLELEPCLPAVVPLRIESQRVQVTAHPREILHVPRLALS